MAAPTGDGVVVLDNRVACRVDLDGSGTVDIFDILAFLTLWSAQGPGSDFDRSGAVDLFDILAFLTEWNLGCP
jgi:hypothetical protein